MKKYVIGLMMISAITVSITVNAQSASLVELTPGSEILDLEGQKRLNNWLAPNLRYTATLLHRASEHDFDPVAFHNDTDDIHHTLVIAKTETGLTVGGYNEGLWNASGSGEFIGGLDENFIFGIEANVKLEATIGFHINVHPSFGPSFVDLSIGSLSTNLLASPGVFYACAVANLPVTGIDRNYECPCNSAEGLCKGYLFNPQPLNSSSNTGVLEYEVWQLNTSGVSTNEIGEVAIDLDDDGNPDYFEDCYTHYTPVFPNSNILDVEEDVLLASYLNPSFHHVSELVYSSDNNGTSASDFISAVNGNEKTMLIARTSGGEIIGAYHEGIWSDEYQELFGMDNNFLFNLTDQRRHNAIEDEFHVLNGASLPYFGSGDMVFTGPNITDGGYSGLGAGYKMTSSTEQNNDLYPYIAATSEFEIIRLEVYKLATTGYTIFFPEDEDENGICDYLDIYLAKGECTGCAEDINRDGFVTAGDLTLFLTAFGTECD